MSKEEMIEEIKKMTVVELSELVKLAKRIKKSKNKTYKKVNCQKAISSFFALYIKTSDVF